jgi:hypothetical protein
VHKLLNGDEKGWRDQAVADIDLLIERNRKCHRAAARKCQFKLRDELEVDYNVLKHLKYLLVHPMPEVGGDDGGERQSPDQVVPRLRVVAGGSGSIGLPNARPSGNLA